jgi:DNA phosphorothioation-associated putative methyltransferase
VTASSTSPAKPPRIRAELTAMGRTGLSLPARLAVTDGLLANRTVLDYGCGRGGDVRRLQAVDIDARGWDPHYRPDPAPEPADVVMCNYVLNVIADPVERARTLQRAFDLARRTLVVAVRGTHEARYVSGDDHADGTVTRRGTFHHLFSPSELRDWLEAVLQVRPVPVQPGVAYVFRNTADRAAYLSRRYGGSSRPDDDGEILQRLIRFLEDHGRDPTVDEQPILCQDAQAAYGRLSRALKAAHVEVSSEALRLAAQKRRLDLLVVLALERFHGGPKLRDLPADCVADTRAWYPNLSEATDDADQLLVATGKMEYVRAAVRRSPVGKTSPTALYVHVDAESMLPPLLRLYSACGAMVAGRPPETTLVKLRHDRAGVSFLSYPTFDRDPHPPIESSLTIDLSRLRGNWTDWAQQQNRPILHRKETFLHPTDRRYDLFHRLSRSEERAGLYERPEAIGRQEGWAKALEEQGLALRGHRLVRATISQSPGSSGDS